VKVIILSKDQKESAKPVELKLIDLNKGPIVKNDEQGWKIDLPHGNGYEWNRPEFAFVFPHQNPVKFEWKETLKI
jgi:hypothetical protein